MHSSRPLRRTRTRTSRCNLQLLSNNSIILSISSNNTTHSTILNILINNSIYQLKLKCRLRLRPSSS